MLSFNEWIAQAPADELLQKLAERKEMTLKAIENCKPEESVSLVSKLQGQTGIITYLAKLVADARNTRERKQS